MGRDLLRRTILKKKATVFFLLLVLGYFGRETAIIAADTHYGGSLLLTRDFIEKPLTQQYIRQYSAPGALSWLSAAMERGGPYLAFIENEINERKLPSELIYLPLIESGYLSTALSRSGASGLWQFMLNSITPFDMVVNDWIDERRDFWKSTHGALNKLQENYDHFGDWPLALAAYNAGLGAVSRAVQQSGIRDYWVLSERKLLRDETVQYVPKLIAAAYILSNPEQFGLQPLTPVDPKWVRVEVGRSVDLNLLADAAGIDRDELIWANTELLHAITPPVQPYFLKIPEKDAEKIRTVLSRTDIPLLHHYVHVIHSGDTLFALARHYGVSMDQILTANPGIQERYLRIGSRLIIPAQKETPPLERPLQNHSFEGTHLVRRGETLWSLALTYGVDIEDLAYANEMSLMDILHEGRLLKTPIK